MLIRHLDFFVTLAEEAHFGRAAELCGVSQPALSQAIRKLEEDLGSQLILRGQRFQGLTAEGEKALIWGRQILSDYRHLQADLSGRRKGGLTGVLQLGISALAMPLLPEFCAHFERRNPLARISVTLLTPSGIRAGLEDFSLDGGIGWLPARRAKSDRTQQTPLWRTGLKFACRADHPFADAGSVNLADVATQPLCLIPDLPPVLPATVQPAILCPGLDTVLAHLRSGAWCSVVPDCIASVLTDDIRLVAISDAPEEYPVGGLIVPRTPRTPMVHAFEEALAAIVAGRPEQTLTCPEKP